jgi:hypothetical protein
MAKRTQEVVEEVITVAEVPEPNFTATLNRNDHPGNRSTYVIQGTPGCIVVKNSLFANGIAPQTISLDVELVAPKAKASTAKLDKLTAAIQKAEAALAAAQAKVEAAQAKIA